MNIFETEYKKLNKAQKEAVDTIEGPVMVVAGPGTGKTQILALRIANILTKTDAKADSILCLTFTNAGVSAMRERLRRYIGPESSKVHIYTFHKFANKILEENFAVLGYDNPPELLDDKYKVLLYDRILKENEWEYLKTRSGSSRYFGDLTSLISILKRERIRPDDFIAMVEAQIKSIENDEGNISTRGVSKGELKKEAQSKIESLYKSKEAGRFYELYEREKTSGETIYFDYDDVLEALVQAIEESDEIKSNLQIEYQYILVDEHQDSSGVQNEFLRALWGEIEKPNIFVVGDDRQLIYGFGGASLEYFENFRHDFRGGKLVTLVENYRSTQNILDSAHLLLQSSITPEKLKSNNEGGGAVRLIEASYERDEVLRFGVEVKKMLEQGDLSPEDFALLVPKNAQAKSAMTILEDMGLPVAKAEKADLFALEDTSSFLNVLRVIARPDDAPSFTRTILNPLSGIPALSAYQFLRKQDMRDFSFVDIASHIKKNSPQTLFVEDDPVEIWLSKISDFVNIAGQMKVYRLLQYVGEKYLLDDAPEHTSLVSRIEIIRTLLHLALLQIEKNPNLTLQEFLHFIDKLREYGEPMPLSVFGASEGIKVLTLHGSKGLEFEYVWVAHVDEASMRGRRSAGFSLPEKVDEKLAERDEETQKRELYVAMTRAKRYCTLSYAKNSYTGGEKKLARVLEEVSSLFELVGFKETEEYLLNIDPKIYVRKENLEQKDTTLADLTKLVARDYVDRKVSVSLLNNFFECPWKWYFRNLIQLPEEMGDSLVFGNIVHNSIDKILKQNNRQIDKKEVEEIVHREFLLISDGSDLKMEKEALSVVLHFVLKRLGEIEDKFENEKSISYTDPKFPHLSIYGKMDLIEFLGGDRVRVTDFKTGNARKRSEIEKVDDDPAFAQGSGVARGRMSDYMRQLTMYAYLLSKSPKWKKEVAEVRLEFVEAENVKEYFYSTQIEDEQIDLLRRDIEDYDEMVKSGAWIGRPCHFKSYGKANTECEYCKMSRIYKKD